MCVIIDRQPGVDIPDDKLELACKINKHGFGLSYIHKDRLYIQRSTDDNNPEQIKRLLNKYKDRRVFLHLRHATVGAVTINNAHPIVVLSKSDKDKQDLVLMHNGTLYKYKPNDTKDETSDTVNFVSKFVQPLALRTQAYARGAVIADPFFRELISEAALSTNVLLLADSQGNVLRINEDKGATFDGWWASNNYSFDASHGRAGNKPPFQTYSTYYGAQTPRGTNRSWENVNNKLPGSGFYVNEPCKFSDFDEIGFDNDEYTASPLMDLHLQFEFNSVQQEITYRERNDTSMVDTTGSLNTSLHTNRKSFIEQAGLESWDEITKLSREDLAELCEKYPRAMAELYVDLLFLAKETLKRFGEKNESVDATQ